MRYTEAQYIDEGFRLGSLTNRSAYAARSDMLNIMLSAEALEDMAQARAWIHQGQVKAIELNNEMYLRNLQRAKA
jgi:hypothetical protein